MDHPLTIVYIGRKIYATSFKDLFFNVFYHQWLTLGSIFKYTWEQRKVLDLLIQPVTDGPHETPELVEEGVPFISVDAIVDNKIDFSRKRGNISEKYDELCCKKYKPQLHDVYLVKSGSTVGKVAIVETTEKFNIWSPLAAMRCGDKTYPYFLYNLLQTKDLQAQVADKASNGTQPNLSMRELEKFPVCVPSNIEEQKKIGAYFEQLDNLITLHQRKPIIILGGFYAE
ncbi:restriction endonuclease subunit S [Roseburia sp. NSJ-9]|uniref:Restriction endonuclease subunit S n=1 Tax=Roseburia lenta TaxID=2763061 RepID=A0ABR7GGJ7_9FIRM|nr:restriction endonuclease subunit S [Roseburia lenta]